MPEYLAPGVFVEETSFRSRSIEGVGTSTAGFVGPARTGPVGGTPELLTSLGDFERIYGGLGNLSYGLNYLAHSVRQFFNEGGSRLYVSRAFAQGATDGRAIARLNGAGPANTQINFSARFPGSGGNGRVTVRLTPLAVNVRALNEAPEGSMVRIGGLGASPATPATQMGGIGPFRLENDSQLLLTVDGAEGAITFRGTAATLQAADAMPASVDLGTATILTVNVDGVNQEIDLPAAATPREEMVNLINESIVGGFATLSDGNELIIGTDHQGSTATVSVSAAPPNAVLPDGTASNTVDANNNVPNLHRVTVDDINNLLIEAGLAVRAAAMPNTGALRLATTTLGAGASLEVRDDPSSAHGQLGLTPAAPDEGEDGSTILYYVKTDNTFRNPNLAGAQQTLNLAGLSDFDSPAGGAELLTFTVVAEDNDGQEQTFEDLGFAATHPNYAGTVLAENPTRRREFLQNTYALTIGSNTTAFDLHTALFGVAEGRMIELSDGNDGIVPTQAAYEAALVGLASLDDISIVAAPGSSAYPQGEGIARALIIHAEQPKAYRIAVLDSLPQQELSDVRALRAGLSSKYAALYYPWVTVNNPVARPGINAEPIEINLPPSGFVSGIYARNDIQRGVYKAPANEVVRGALRFEANINTAQQEVLNPLGVNCLRYFPGNGYRVWGARTVSTDPEWRYVNIRRYFNYVAASIDRGTQWAVFEPNNESLWANIRDTVSSFLYAEWISGALLGASEDQAYFVRCDRSTMTQSDLDAGRLICLVGIAVVKPAEFVIFRIGQKTADARS